MYATGVSAKDKKAMEQRLTEFLKQEKSAEFWQGARNTYAIHGGSVKGRLVRYVAGNGDRKSIYEAYAEGTGRTEQRDRRRTQAQREKAIQERERDLEIANYKGSHSAEDVDKVEAARERLRKKWGYH